MADELIRLTATEAVARLRRREISPLDLIDAAAARIAAVEPAVNALPTLCLDRARDHAKRLMDGHGREAEGEPGWLAGLPVAIKDLTDVAGVRTTYGSPIFRDHVPATSHPVVERIERKGGIVIAKSNTPEFGAGGSTFNEVFGRTRNPWNTSLTCGGSTGGGAVALATGEVWLAHGTDHGGSLRRPGDLLFGGRTAAVARTGDARHVEQPVVAAVGAGTDGAQHAGPCAVPRCDGRTVPARSADLRCARGVVRAVGRRGEAAAPHRLHRGLWRQDHDRPGNARDLRTRGAPLRGTGLRGRGIRPRPRRDRRGVHGAAVAAFRGGSRAADADASRPDQAGHHLEHREGPGADAEPHCLGRARTRRILPPVRRDVRDVRHLRLAECRHAGVRCEPAASRVCRTARSSPTTWALRR